MRTDMRYLQDISRGNKEIINEMIDIFVEQVAEVSEAMDNALVKNDYAALGSLAHKAKVSISIMGMKELAEDLKKLEINSQTSSMIDTYAITVEKFKFECKEAVEELLKIKKESNL